MNKHLNYLSMLLLFSMMTLLSGCDLIVGIFKGGMYFGIILVILVVAIIIWLISKFTKR